VSFFCGDVVAKEQLPGVVGSASVYVPPAAAVGTRWLGPAVVKRRLTHRQLRAIHQFIEAERSS